MELGAVEDGSDDIDDDDDDDLAGGLQAGKYYCMVRGTVALEDMIGIHYHNYCERERTLGRTAKEADGSGLLVVCRYVDQCSTCATRLSQWKKVYIYIYTKLSRRRLIWRNDSCAKHAISIPDVYST